MLEYRKTMGALENILPEDLKNHALTVGNDSASTQSELVLPFILTSASQNEFARLIR